MARKDSRTWAQLSTHRKYILGVLLLCILNITKAHLVLQLKNLMDHGKKKQLSLNTLTFSYQTSNETCGQPWTQTYHKLPSNCSVL